MTIGFYDIIGSDTDTILWWQMSIRAVFIFAAALLLVRLGATRIYGKYGSLDIVMTIILGSILSRALTGNARFFPTLAAALTLVLLHLVLVKSAIHSRWIGHLVKGKEIKLIENGRIIRKGLLEANMTDHDLLEALRSEASLESFDTVKAAYLERNGKVSVIT
ncbi:MAG: DUF421 domain-containing protein [Desulfobulbaceae bacterium]|nr:DUF421 domain-containing protein [Desulfobulbaceae bacterium]